MDKVIISVGKLELRSKIQFYRFLQAQQCQKLKTLKEKLKGIILHSLSLL